MRIPNVAVEVYSTDGEKFITWLSDFLAANRDGIDENEAAEIIATIEGGEKYYGGGGAAAEWTVRRADQRRAA